MQRIEPHADRRIALEERLFKTEHFAMHVEQRDAADAAADVVEIVVGGEEPVGRSRAFVLSDLEGATSGLRNQHLLGAGDRNWRDRGRAAPREAEGHNGIADHGAIGERLDRLHEPLAVCTAESALRLKAAHSGSWHIAEDERTGDHVADHVRIKGLAAGGAGRRRLSE